MSKCIYCDPTKRLQYLPDNDVSLPKPGVRIKEGLLLVDAEDIYAEEFPINYCPMCGREFDKESPTT